MKLIKQKYPCRYAVSKQFRKTSFSSLSFFRVIGWPALQLQEE